MQRRPLLLRAAFFLGCLTVGCTAYAQQPGYITDPRTGCKAFDPTADLFDSITWSGTCQNGLAQGPGTLEWHNDGETVAKAQGEFDAGKQVGRGIFSNDIGERYEGEFHDGNFSGQGTYVYSDGGRYDGAWREGVKSGAGTFLYAGGDRYEGSWANDTPDGPGTLTTKNGSKITGVWRDGCLTQEGQKMAVDLPTPSCVHR